VVGVVSFCALKRISALWARWICEAQLGFARIKDEG
jgi:hypothetical protein